MTPASVVAPFPGANLGGALPPVLETRSANPSNRDGARALASTPEYEAACRRRKEVEMLFAHLKRILRLGRLRLRGPCGAKDEFLLAATAQNLRRRARLRPGSAPMGAIAA